MSTPEEEGMPQGLPPSPWHRLVYSATELCDNLTALVKDVRELVKEERERD